MTVYSTFGSIRKQPLERQVIHHESALVTRLVDHVTGHIAGHAPRSCVAGVLRPSLLKHFERDQRDLEKGRD
jgi:hypothetical protein